MNEKQALLEDLVSRLQYYKSMGDKVILRLDPNALLAKSDEASNSIALIVQHMAGNMKSRWSGFPDADGEKPWRLRDREFEERHMSKSEITDLWENGWAEVFKALDNMSSERLYDKTTIRETPLPVFSAIIRQLAHYAYHVGQMVYQAKIIMGDKWESLSIPVGKSGEFNEKLRLQHLKGNKTDRPLTRHIHDQIKIKAGVDRIFTALITPNDICSWWQASQATVAPVQGGLWLAVWGDPADPDYITQSSIKIFEPSGRLRLGDYHYFSKGAGIPLSFSPDVDFVIESGASESTLKVTQSGFPGGTEADEFYEGCVKGWRDTLEGIKKHLE